MHCNRMKASIYVQCSLLLRKQMKIFQVAKYILIMKFKTASQF